MEAGWSTTTSTVPCLACSFAEHFAELRLAVGQPLVEGLLPGRGDGGGVVFALADVQAEEGADVTDVDHARPSVVLARPSHGTDRHIHITKSLPTCEEAGGHAPNQRSVDASGAGDTTPQDMRSTGGESMPTPKAGRPIAGLPKR